MGGEIRYIRQRDTFSCGPVALMNLDKYLGKRVTYSDLKKYRKKCKCSKVNRGTRFGVLSSVLKKRGYKYTYKMFKNIFKNKDVAIVAYDEHYFLVIDACTQDGVFGFKCINASLMHTIAFVQWQSMKMALKYSRVWRIKT